MKKLVLIFFVALSFAMQGQTSTVTYPVSSTAIANPERGFFKFTETHSNAYSSLNATTLTNYRVNQKITLIYRAFYLENFINTPISAAYLTLMQQDFDKIRQAGLKCIIRFAYADDESAIQRDATKTQMLSHIQQIAPLLQANEDVISVLQAGFIGLWGEWYYTSQPEFGGWGYNQTNLTTTNNNHRRDIMNALLNALPASRMIQVRYPSFKQTMYSSTAVSTSQAFTQTNLARLAHHNDCFLASSTDFGTYDNVSTQYPYLEQDTKFVAMGGETCAINLPRSGCASALQEMSKFHWSFLNMDYFPGVISGFQTDNCFADIENKLGYRLEMRSSTFPVTAMVGSILPVTMRLFNTGFASPYNARNVSLILKNQTTNQIIALPLNTDPRRWLGPNEITISENIQLPSSLPVGNYRLYLHIADASPSLATRPEYAIQLANTNMWDATNGYNNLNYILNVTSPLALAETVKIESVIYPVPAQDELYVEMAGIEDYQVILYNALGQKIDTQQTVSNNRKTLYVRGLGEGVYFVEVSKDGIKDTQRVVLTDD
ncbi:MAG: hypothetical protein RLZZ500_1013 [Bacteroidota bacterium]|jgi:hypothetical protein